MNAVLLSTTYFGPVQWYQKLYRADETWIEGCESFQKQTFRNRCIIATTQGLQALTVPVERTADAAQTIRDVRLSDHGNWRHLHWNALVCAYRESPFFDYYQDDIRPFFERRWTYLLDFNEAIRETVCELIDIHPTVAITTSYVRAGQLPTATGGQPTPLRQPSASPTPALADFREAITPKHPAPDPDFLPKPYYQVYARKHGFLPNLSVLDLLFNMGPEAIFFL